MSELPVTVFDLVVHRGARALGAAGLRSAASCTRCSPWSPGSARSSPLFYGLPYVRPYAQDADRSPAHRRRRRRRPHLPRRAGRAVADHPAARRSGAGQRAGRPGPLARASSSASRAVLCWSASPTSPLQWLMPRRPRARLARGRPHPAAGRRRRGRCCVGLVPSEHAARQTSESADAARDRARQALESDQMMRDILNPQPKGPPVGSEPPAEGYGDRERKELERLLQANR